MMLECRVFESFHWEMFFVVSLFRKTLQKSFRLLWLIWSASLVLQNSNSPASAPVSRVTWRSLWLSTCLSPSQKINAKCYIDISNPSTLQFSQPFSPVKCLPSLPHCLIIPPILWNNITLWYTPEPTKLNFIFRFQSGHRGGTFEIIEKLVPSLCSTVTKSSFTLSLTRDSERCWKAVTLSHRRNSAYNNTPNLIGNYHLTVCVFLVSRAWDDETAGTSSWECKSDNVRYTFLYILIDAAVGFFLFSAWNVPFVRNHPWRASCTRPVARDLQHRAKTLTVLYCLANKNANSLNNCKKCKPCV